MPPTRFDINLIDHLSYWNIRNMSRGLLFTKSVSCIDDRERVVTRSVIDAHDMIPRSSQTADLILEPRD
jgi:hypothetical protein